MTMAGSGPENPDTRSQEPVEGIWSSSSWATAWTVESSPAMRRGVKALLTS
ncbi:hypothetical protein [Nocardioides endophyticus]|uniref:hypothetical protein n=1 Tax=Nocardioides endophyticus TaxID=1353775 RepID=UPI0031F1518C